MKVTPLPVKKQKVRTPKNQPKPEPKPILVPTRKTTRVRKSVTNDFNVDLYGYKSSGKCNKYHGTKHDRFDRYFNGSNKPCMDEIHEEIWEDRRILKELQNYEIGHAGYALDNFIANEEADEYENESDDEIEDTDDEYESESDDEIEDTDDEEGYW